ncbi:MAG: hypothetical protein RLY16_2352, partial [Bacteroidota bacterium]
TVWVATTLFKNGKVFLLDIFHGNQELADSVNKLLLAGFYLINVGYMVYTLRIVEAVPNAQIMIEELSRKIGWIILILGGMHFFNLFVFFKLRKRALHEKRLNETFRQVYEPKNL